jgi:hypothetical protein
MKPWLHLSSAVLLVLFASWSRASEMRDELLVDASNRGVLRTRFATYGYWPRQAILVDAGGLRFRLPGGVAGVPQTGLYSLFALAGDCEVMLSYELLDVPSPQGGYGSGVGLAFDLGEGSGRGAIQRVLRKPEGSGFVLQTTPGDSAKGTKEVDKFVPTASKRGRIGLRRIKNELIFLRADSATDPLQEIDRLSFSDRTIRTVRVFADPGGSPTAVDVRISQIEIRAEEIAAGVPQLSRKGWGWGWLWGLGSSACGALVFWIWRSRRRRELLKHATPSAGRRR